MRKTNIFAALLALLLVSTPTALAGHSDPTHGVAPHSVGVGIQPTALSTPHPYEMDTTYTWTVDVDGADSISLHFERWDVNGYYSSWQGRCSGSNLAIFDGNTGLLLGEYCGSQDAEFWTPAYETDSLVLELTTAGYGSGYYGFDVYELAVDGGSSIASIPYSYTPYAGVTPTVSAEPDVFDPAASESQVRGVASAEWGPTGVRQDLTVMQGQFYDCSGLFCQEVDGTQGREVFSAEGAGQELEVRVSFTIVENDAAPGGYVLSQPQVSCTLNGKSC